MQIAAGHLPKALAHCRRQRCRAAEAGAHGAEIRAVQWDF
jgi:hypothetical protein